MSIARTYGSILDAVRGLTWPARQRASGTHAGTHKSRLRGRAPELSEYRLYRQGDDPRQLDWKLLARSDRAFVRLSEDRSVHPTWFVIDASASMAFPQSDGAPSKWSAACALVIGLASIAQRSGDPVGASIAAAGGSVTVRARTRVDVLSELASALGSVRPSGSSPVAEALLPVAQRARVVVISDLLGDEEALRRACAVRGTAGGDVHVMHIVSRLELHPPREVRLVSDPEDASMLRPMDDAARTTYERDFAEWRSQTARAWRLAGAAYTQVVAEEDTASVIRAAVTGASERR